MTGATPAQAAANTFVTGCVARGITASAAAVPPEGKLDVVRELWADVARAVVAAYIEANGGDPVDPARVIAEAIVPELRAVYRERARLVAYLAACYPSEIVEQPGKFADEWPVIFIAAPTGQLSWHLSRRDLDLFDHVPKYIDGESRWDGHTTEEKYERLVELVPHATDARDETARLRDLVAEILGEVELGTLGQHNAAATTRTLARTAQWRKSAELPS